MEHINSHSSGRIDKKLNKVGLNFVWLNILKIAKSVSECTKGELKVEAIDANISIGTLLKLKNVKLKT
jgi:hypothetical protein